MIPTNEYIRIVLGAKSMLRNMQAMIRDMPPEIEERKILIAKVHKLEKDINHLYKDLKDQGLLE